MVIATSLKQDKPRVAIVVARKGRMFDAGRESLRPIFENLCDYTIVPREPDIDSGARNASLVGVG